MSEPREEKCYYCGKPSETIEHVPPKCIFPEEKDIGSSAYRTNLFTVPSCKKHNNDKSQDDEYLFFVIIAGGNKNEIGDEQFKTKMMRIVKRSPIKIAKYFESVQITQAIDKKTGLVSSKLAINIDIEKLNNILVAITKALFYFEFHQIADGKTEVHLNGCVFGNANQKMNPLLYKLEKKSEKLFENEEWKGENKDVFKYKCKRIMIGKIWFLLCFYDFSEYVTEHNY